MISTVSASFQRTQKWWNVSIMDDFLPVTVLLSMHIYCTAHHTCTHTTRGIICVPESERSTRVWPYECHNSGHLLGNRAATEGEVTVELSVLKGRYRAVRARALCWTSVICGPQLAVPLQTVASLHGECCLIWPFRALVTPPLRSCSRAFQALACCWESSCFQAFVSGVCTSAC